MVLPRRCPSCRRPRSSRQASSSRFAVLPLLSVRASGVRPSYVVTGTSGGRVGARLILMLFTYVFTYVRNSLIDLAVNNNQPILSGALFDISWFSLFL